MACFSPLRGYRTADGSITHSLRMAVDDNLITVSCKQCAGCRLNRSKDWAIRCCHEAELYGLDNCFITLTYNDEHLPAYGTLNKPDFQKFMKRLRKKILKKYGRTRPI